MDAIYLILQLIAGFQRKLKEMWGSLKPQIANND